MHLEARSVYTRDMDQFTQFVINHWSLWVAFVAVTLLIIFEESRGSVKGVVKVSSPQLTQLINHDGAVVVDVRKSEEFVRGHIAGALNIAADNFANSINKLNKNKAKPIILVCALGTVSLRLGATLRKNEFTKIYALNGGIVSWQKAGLPLVTGSGKS